MNREKRFVVVCALTACFLASIPYLWGLFITNENFVFRGFTHNIDDVCVYLSWMRQAADGSPFITNLFTNDPQSGRAFNVLFLLLGLFSRVTRIPLEITFHLARLLSGFFLVFVLWRFSRNFLTEERQRKIAVLLLCFTSGLGWVLGGPHSLTGSADLWQPESVTFLSIYLNPLFCVSLMLIIGGYDCLLKGRGVRAGLCLLLLGNIHTYDIVTFAAVWSVYLICLWIKERRFPARLVLMSLAAAVIALPSALYQLYIYKIDPVYYARANSAALSPKVWMYFMGYGLTFLFALWALVSRKIGTRLLPAVWAVAGFVTPYIPVGQQRKLVMGLHIPLCFLAAAAVAHITANMSRRGRVALIGAVLVLGCVSNAMFMGEDLYFLNNSTTAPRFSPFASRQELRAAAELRKVTPPGATIAAPPMNAVFLPYLTGRAVYMGHWSETPDYRGKLNTLMNMLGYKSDLPKEEVRDALKGVDAFLLSPEDTLPDGYEVVFGNEAFRVAKKIKVAVKFGN
ncbi:MAG: hypothetical protein J6332_04435 [Abditibacteriota bacterium]|nr:hypothetical protein [Abditibacteriota bacterium]